MNEALKTVRFQDLCPDRCNFKDKTFEQAVDRFMERYMTGFSIGLLDTSSELAFERWQVEPEERFKVIELKLVVHTCGECREEYTFAHGSTEEPEVCCPLESLAAQEGEEPELWEVSEPTWLVLEDTHYNDTLVDNAGDHSIDLPDGSTVWGWYEESRDDALQVASEKDREAMNEGQAGFPWANGWCFLPDDRIDTQDLKDAGFTVATYCGGRGNWREDDEYTLCGIDGGGYSFKGQHFALLYFAHCLRRGWDVETDNGPARPVEDE